MRAAPSPPGIRHTGQSPAQTVQDLREIFNTGVTRPLQWRLAQLDGIESSPLSKSSNPVRPKPACESSTSVSSIG